MAVPDCVTLGCVRAGAERVWVGGQHREAGFAACWDRRGECWIVYDYPAPYQALPRGDEWSGRPQRTRPYSFEACAVFPDGRATMLSVASFLSHSYSKLEGGGFTTLARSTYTKAYAAESLALQLPPLLPLLPEMPGVSTMLGASAPHPYQERPRSEGASTVRIDVLPQLPQPREESNLMGNSEEGQGLTSGQPTRGLGSL